MNVQNVGGAGLLTSHNGYVVSYFDSCYISFIKGPLHDLSICDNVVYIVQYNRWDVINYVSGQLFWTLRIMDHWQKIFSTEPYCCNIRFKFNLFNVAKRKEGVVTLTRFTGLCMKSPISFNCCVTIQPGPASPNEVEAMQCLMYSE